MSNLKLKNPVFLLGSERSGSNLLRVIMGGHSNICAPTSPHILKSFYPILPQYGDLSDDNNFELLCQHAAAHMNNHIGVWNHKYSAEEFVDEISERSFIGLFDYIYNREQEENGSKRVFFKENDTFDFAYMLLSKYPDCKFIYLVRDGRDYSLSYKNSPVHFGSIVDASKQWSDEQKKVLSIYSDLIFEKRILAIHYEDLVDDSKREFKKICDWLGEPYEEKALDFHKSSENQKASEMMVAWKNLSQPVLKQNYGKYKNKFSSREIRNMERVSFKELILCGYPVESTRGSLAKMSRRSLFSFSKKVIQFGINMLRGEKSSLKEIEKRRQKVKAENEILSELGQQLEPMLECSVYKQR